MEKLINFTIINEAFLHSFCKMNPYSAAQLLQKLKEKRLQAELNSELSFLPIKQSANSNTNSNNNISTSNSDTNSNNNKLPDGFYLMEETLHIVSHEEKIENKIALWHVGGNVTGTKNTEGRITYYFKCACKGKPSTSKETNPKPRKVKKAEQKEKKERQCPAKKHVKVLEKDGKFTFSFTYKFDHTCEGINTNKQRLTTEEKTEIVEVFQNSGSADHTLSELRDSSTIPSDKLTRKNVKKAIKKLQR